MWWPREPYSDCLTRLSASWLWTEPGGDNVYQILLPSHALCVHAAARRQAFRLAHAQSHCRPLFIPTVNTLVIHWRFRLFSDGWGSHVNVQPTCWQADVETRQVFSGVFILEVASSKLILQWAWISINVHVGDLNLHFALVAHNLPHKTPNDVLIF